MDRKNLLVAKVLFIDNDKQTKSLFEQLISLNVLEVEFCETIDQVNEIYRKDLFDIVLINFMIEDGEDSLNHILKINPQQKIITLSEELLCSDTRGCELCQKEFNKRRLLKPLSAENLIDTINQFGKSSCKYQDKFNSTLGLLEIMPDILTRYTSVEYDEENKLANISSFSDMIEIIELFEDKNISLDLISDKQLKISAK